MLILLRNIKRKLFERYLKIKYISTIPTNPHHDDIYIVEFPKSGVTWLINIIGNIELFSNKNVKNNKITFFNNHKYISDLHGLRGIPVNRRNERTFIKSHCEYTPLYYFVIYLYREPSSVMISYYNFMVERGYKGSFEQFIRSEAYGMPAWSRHINGWADNGVSLQKMYFLSYENLQENPKKVIKDLYESLGVLLDSKVIDDALENSSLDEMSRYEGLCRKYNPNYKTNFVGSQNKIPRSELLNNENLEYIEKFKNQAKSLGVKF